MSYLNIKLQASDDKEYTLSDFKGKKIVLYFYPKDNTSGCTLESKDFTMLKNEFKEKGYMIIGCSRDSVKSHKNFINKQDLDLLLLSDSNEELVTAFDVMKEKSMYGKTYMGIERSTFIINSKGKLIQEWRKVKVKGHVDEVLKVIKNISA